jgi:hypothetical protein
MEEKVLWRIENGQGREEDIDLFGAFKVKRKHDLSIR